MADPLHLPYTLQTWVGMVLNSGAPARRRRPTVPRQYPGWQESLIFDAVWALKIEKFEDYLVHDWNAHPKIVDRAVTYLRRERNPIAKRSALPDGVIENNADRFYANINACRETVTQDDLKKFIRTRTRFDLEQAAALVLSALMSSGRVDDATSLVKELTGILTTSDMWIEDGVQLPTRETGATADKNLCGKLQAWCAKSGTVVESPPQSLSDLVELLLRIRRHDPRDRCLHIPIWMFKESGVKPPGHMEQFFAMQDPLQKSRVYPSLPPTSDAIIMSRKLFRGLQRRVFRLFRFWKADHRLRRDVRILQDEVLLPTEWMERHVFQADNVAYLSHWFFQTQRRLQKKVVSDFDWSRFLVKGEGKVLYQNNVRVQSTFEQALARLAEQTPGTPENEPLATPGSVLALIDRTCLLMREYVNVYGAGSKENLVFKPGQHGGSGRGPVDEYNLLCDILSELKNKGRDMAISDLPGPVHKFLAKDIMAWNNAWAEDAFANGKIPGWETWLEHRAVYKLD